MWIGGLLAAGAGGCATNTGTGALVGGTSGALAGAAITHHAGGAVAGGIIGTVAGALVGNAVDRDEAYHRHYYYDSYGPPVVERRTTYVNPDGSTTTYIDRSYGY